MKYKLRSQFCHHSLKTSLLIGLLGLSLSLGIHRLPQVRAEPPIAAQNSALVWVQAGKNHYDHGQFSQAVQVLQQAAQNYQLTGDILKQAQVLSLLSLSYQKLGQWEQAEQTINTSLSLLDTVAENSDRVRAQALNAQGRLQLARGNAEAALATWQNAETLYQRVDDQVGIVGSQINQAEAMQALGMYRRTERLLQELEQKLLNINNTALKATGLQNLGNVRRQGGDLEESQRILTQSLAFAQQLKSPQEESEILLSLGNTERTLAKRAQAFNDENTAKNYIQEALNHYQQAALKATAPLTRIQAQLNQLSLLIESEQLTRAQAILPEISAEISTLPASRASVYAHVNLAESLIKMSFVISHSSLVKSNVKNNGQLTNYITEILDSAIHQAENLADQRAESYSLGTLGKLYEKTQDWKKAKNVSQKALLVAQQINASDIAYQWQWQLGRVLQAQTEQTSQIQQTANPDAIAYYTAAFNTLSSLRSDIVALNSEIQFSFRENVEPIYRQLVDLLLRAPTPTKDNLIQARNVMEALQLAELDNFFQDACAQSAAVNIDNVDKQAAIIYPIILNNRLEVIIKLPGEDNLHHYANQGISEAEVDAAVEQLRTALTRRSTSISQVKKASQKLYDWLIQPFETHLASLANQEQTQIKTLVFVLDGSLRNIPPGVLYDGKKYLIERYAIALTPGLQLIEPKPLLAQNLRVLAAGATNAPSFQQENFTSLDNVDVELAEIREQLQQSEILENQQFLQENLQNKINSNLFNIVHIATHGKFSSNPQETFLLDWNKRIKIRDLDNLLNVNEANRPTSIELLILSACETAAGDKRAALGLAGIAVRAGARSTLATLWQVNDASTAEFMRRFYQQLNNREISKAEALRNTQIAFLSEYPDTDYNRAYFWGAFIMLGNWL